MTGRGPEGSIDLGSGVYMRYFTWRPDRRLNPQYADIPDDPKAGIIVGHVHDDGKICEGSVRFDTAVYRLLAERNSVVAKESVWTVESWRPLTISPSILMSPDKGGCGLHGFIRDGRWVGA